MNIVFENQYTDFSSVKTGEIFIYGDKTYMKVISYDDTNEAVNLPSGIAYPFDNEVVIVVDATLTVNYNKGGR
jgi:hypothetical protein